MKISRNVTVGALVGIALFGIGLIGLLGFSGGSVTPSVDIHHYTEAIAPTNNGVGEMVAADVGTNVSANIGTTSNDFDESSLHFAAWRDIHVAGLPPNGNFGIKFTPATSTDSNEISMGDASATLAIAWKEPSEKASDIGVRFDTSIYPY
ncbi:MAG: hypothetical protein LBI16_03980 [Burkholderiales bacterium]|jgi:hypothetical protein|nr:hypothetical protein [Burkholderiales bacterium]